MTLVARIRQQMFLGEATVQFGTNKKQNLEVAQRFLKQQGMNSTTETATGRKISKIFAAIYNPGAHYIFLNPSSGFWKDPVGIAAYNHRIGQLSTDDPLGVLWHELAHAKFDPPDNLAPFEVAIAKEVSDYARRSPKEFVAEVYAGLQTGRTYSQRVMQVYSRYTDPRLYVRV